MNGHHHLHSLSPTARRRPLSRYAMCLSQHTYKRCFLHVDLKPLLRSVTIANIPNNRLHKTNQAAARLAATSGHNKRYTLPGRLQKLTPPRNPANDIRD